MTEVAAPLQSAAGRKTSRLRLARATLSMMLCPIPAMAVALQPAAAPSRPCPTVDSCIAALIAAAQARRQVHEEVRRRLVEFGDDAVEALVPLLMHADRRVRDSAGLSLAGFRRIDPRHLPDLIAAWRDGDALSRLRRGNGWMPRSIAATGTDEAFDLLWQDYLRDPHHGSNAQVFFALADMGDRIRPRLEERFAACRADETGTACEGIYSLLRELHPPFPPWSVEAVVDLVGNARSDEVRREAEMELARLNHPAALVPLQRRLAAYPEAAALEDRGWDVRSLIGAVARYGAAARASGPAIGHYLGARHDEDLRAEAALALGQVEDPDAIPALLALEPDLGSDWLLAYNVAESLGRLRAAEARSLLGALARDHWHGGVRNNAARALNAIGGGAFARPDVAGDGQPYPVQRNEQGEEYLYFGNLRFAGDDASRRCRAGDEATVRLARAPVGTIRWPRRGTAIVDLADVDESIERSIRDRVDVRQARGSVMAVLAVRDGLLVGFNAGEFGGGLFHLPEQGTARPLLGEQVVAAWRMGRQLYLSTGVAHGVLDTGHLYVVDPDRLRVERIVRLPASPRGLAISSRRAVIVETQAGDLVVRADGTLADAGSFDACGEA